MHALRHSMATRLAEDGASTSEVQRILGHESLNTSQAYIDATANDQRAAVRANRTYRALGRTAKRNVRWRTTVGAALGHFWTSADGAAVAGNGGSN